MTTSCPASRSGRAGRSCSRGTPPGGGGWVKTTSPRSSDCCRPETGRAYYMAAMQSHGLPGKIPNSFTTGRLTDADIANVFTPCTMFVTLCCSGEAFLREHPVQLPHRGVQRRDRGGDGQDHEHICGGGKINVNNFGSL